MTQSAYALVGLTALVAGLVGLLVFALLRFGAAVGDVRRQLREGSAERAFVAGALEDAIGRLRGQELAMQARAESSERLNSQIVSSLASGLLLVGLQGDVRMLNPAGRRMLRRPHVEEGADFHQLLEHAKPLADLLDACLSTGRPILRRTIPIKQADGPELHFGVTISPMGDGLGTVHGAICLFTDLTAVVVLEEQLRLKESLARLGELTAGLAHEFRNGLATIHGYARLLDPSLLPAPHAAYVQGLRDETEALGRIVNNFLNFARPVQLTVAPVEVGPLVNRVADEIRPEVVSRGGTLVVQGEFGTVDGDEVLLRQTVFNLLRNATEACGQVPVSPRLVIEGRVDTTLRELVLHVVDNGPGIDPALREKVFQPFYTTKGHGTGLGLALVQKIVVTHNGRVSVSASNDGGAAFQIVLPLSRAE